MKTLKSGKEVTEYLNQSEEHRVMHGCYTYYQRDGEYYCSDGGIEVFGAGALVCANGHFAVIEPPPKRMTIKQSLLESLGSRILDNEIAILCDIIEARLREKK